LFSFASLAGASDRVAVRVEYSVPAGCPDQGAFERSVTARTARFEAAVGGRGARVLRVAVHGSDVGFSGDLEISDSLGTTRRLVSAGTCADVVSALALVAALTIDALPTAGAGADVRAVAASAAPAPPAWPAPLDARVPAPVVPAAMLVRAVEARDARLDDAEPRETSRYRVSAGGGVDAMGFGGTGVVVAPSVVVEGRVVGTGALSPAIRIEMLRSVAASISEANGKAAFSWWLGRVQACPIQLSWLRRFTLRPCLAVAAGVLQASTFGVSDGFSPNRAWVAPDLEARVAWAVTHTLSVEAEGGAGVPFIRNVYSFAPSPEVFQATAVFPVGSLRILLSFP